MRLVDGVIDDRAQPGDAEYFSERGRDYAGLLFRCPRCGALGEMPFEPRIHGRSAWKWDGNVDAPTLHPSIRHVDPACGWHGWLRAGEFVG